MTEVCYMSSSSRGIEADYPNHAFNTWVQYKLEQKCSVSASPDGLYIPMDILREINEKLGTKYTIQRFSQWRSLSFRAIPDVVINEFVNPELHLVMGWYFTKKGYFNTKVDTDDLAEAFKVPVKQKAIEA
jgi:hypothetical protein